MRRPASVLSRRLGRVALVLLCALIPTGARAQGAGTLLDRPARLDVRDLPLEKALTLLQRSSGVSLAFSPDLLSRHRHVSCACKGVTVAVALDRMLAGTGLRYRLGERKVIVGRWSEAGLSDGGHAARALARRPRARLSTAAQGASASWAASTSSSRSGASCRTHATNPSSATIRATSSSVSSTAARRPSAQRIFSVVGV